MVTSIVAVELLGGIGDALMLLPAVHALARHHAPASVTVVTFSPAHELLEADPLIDEPVGLARGDMEQVAASLRAVLRGRRFDLAVTDTRYGDVPAIVAAAAPLAVVDLWRSPPADVPIPQRFLDLLVADGLVDAGDADPRPVVTVPAPARAAADVLLDGIRRPAVALVPDAGMAIKRWPLARYAELATALAGRGVTPVVVTGTSPQLATTLAAEVEGSVALPPLRLPTLAATLAALDACVSADTGPGRLAAAVGTPTVAVFGPTVADRFGIGAPHVDLDAPVRCDARRPLDMTRQPCWWSGRCIHEGMASCTEAVSVDDVLRALEAALPSAVTAPSGR